MPFTIKFHNNILKTPEDWTPLTIDKIGHIKYKTEMTNDSKSRIIAAIVILSIFSLGTYFIYLKCSDMGEKELKNLKNRTIIHYVKEKSNKEKNNSVQPWKVIPSLKDLRIVSNKLIDDIYSSGDAGKVETILSRYQINLNPIGSLASRDEYPKSQSIVKGSDPTQDLSKELRSLEDQFAKIKRLADKVLYEEFREKFPPIQTTVQSTGDAKRLRIENLTTIPDRRPVKRNI